MQTTAKLSVPEVFALLTSVTAMRAAGNLPFSELADAGLAKIEKALPADKIKDLRAFLDCLHIGQLSTLQDLSDMGKMDPELLTAFATAFLGRRFIRFTYRDAKAQETRREVEPQAMLILPPPVVPRGLGFDACGLPAFQNGPDEQSGGYDKH